MTATSQIEGYTVGTWDIDTVHSEIEFTLRHMGVGRSRGRFDSFTGEIVTAENPLDSTVNAQIDASSINTGQNDRDNHVRSADFLDVENYSNAGFRSTGIRQDGEKFLIDGEFTLHGTTQPVTLDAELGGFTDDGQGGTLLGLSAETNLKRTDFGVGPKGGAMLGEQVKIILEVEAALRK